MKIKYNIVLMVVWWTFLLFLAVSSARVDYAAEETTTSSTSDQWSDKIVLPLNLEYTSYTMDWSAEALSPDIGAIIEVRFLRDADVLSEFAVQATTGWVPVSGFYICYVSTGVHTFSIQYRSQVDGVQVFLRRGRIRVEEKNVYFAPGTPMM